MKKYIGGEFILQSDDVALYIATNDSRSQTNEAFTWQGLEEEGICRRPSGVCGNKVKAIYEKDLEEVEE